MTERRCPSPVELERAYWQSDASVSAHVDSCAACRAVFSEIESLVDTGRTIEPSQQPARRREELRTSLLSKMESPAPTKRAPLPRSRYVFPIAAMAAAAAFVIVVWSWPSSDRARVAARDRRSQILDHADARYLVASLPPDE